MVIVLVLLGSMLFQKDKPAGLPPIESYGQDLPQADREKFLTRIAQYQQLVRDNPKVADHWLQLGINQDALGALPHAIISYKKAGELAPNSFLPFLNIGNIYVTMGNYAEAEVAYFTAVKDDPIKVYLYRPLVELYEQHLTNKKYKVPELLNAGLKQEALKENPELLGMLAVYYKDNGDVTNAIPVYERLIKADPSNTAAKDELAELKKR